MLKINKIESLDELSQFKKHYFESSTAPLDGMWHFGFVPMAKHFGFYFHNELIGFCCINDEGYLLQFFVEQSKQALASDLFTLIVEQNSAELGEVKGAFVSTAETNFLANCLDNSSSFKVNALMYQKPVDQNVKSDIDMQLASEDQLRKFVSFAVDSIGAPEQWLTSYYGNLIQRKELFGYWNDGKLLATGECRLFDEYQTAYADLGMVVAQSERGQGIAKQVLSFLTNHAKNQGLKSICSTESSNVGAQKAISHAGFTSSHRIVQFEFNQTS
jgi:predicted acetyltransferase